MRKGKKAVRNQPLFYGEVKKKHGVWLTDVAWQKLKSVAIADGVSVSELLERYARGL